ncbi:MAG: hypothetical protein K0S85_182 [Pseudomonas orientalis]|nr:hypothetical protein [Pseudomonas orientalis]
MKFTIDAVVLWASNSDFTPRVIPFVEGKINIIHGLSSTGKSSIVHIIDYVMGSKKCHIPVGIIRTMVSWFGLKVRIHDSQYLLARRSPGKGEPSTEFYLQPVAEEIPAMVVRTHSQQNYQAALDGMVRISDLPHSDDEKPKGYDTRSSYRDMAAFNFLPQHIVANPNTLFFKTDTVHHRERLKRAMPYALGMVDGSYVLNERRREEAMRDRDRLRRELQAHEDAKSSHFREVDRLLDRCLQLGLLPRQEYTSPTERVEKLRSVLTASLEGRLEATLLEPQRLHLSEKLKKAIEATAAQQLIVNALDTQVDGLDDLNKNNQRFFAAVTTEQTHVVGLDWLKESALDDGHCVACGSYTNALPMVIENLEEKISKITRISDALRNNPILDKQINGLKRKRAEEERILSGLRREQNRLVSEDERFKSVLGQIYFVAGEISTLFKNLDCSTGKQDVIARLAELDKLISHFNFAMSKVDRAEQERKLDARLTPMIEDYADEFPLSAAGGANIVLDKTELTLRFDLDENSDYLWEIGSGANWMGYHIAAFLGIHEFLSLEENRHLPPFSFIVIDQPSQVYFPSSASGSNALDDGFQAVRNTRSADVIATRRIFEVLSKAVERSGHYFQIIVLEHAGPDIWRDVPHTHPVEAWDQKGDGLLPQGWIQAM